MESGRPSKEGRRRKDVGVFLSPKEDRELPEGAAVGEELDGRGVVGELPDLLPLLLDTCYVLLGLLEQDDLLRHQHDLLVEAVRREPQAGDVEAELPEPQHRGDLPGEALPPLGRAVIFAYSETRR